MTFDKVQRSILFIVIITFCFSVPVFAQKQVTGTWKAKYKDKDPESIQMSFYSEGDQKFGPSIRFERLKGLSIDQVKASSGNVSFTILSEAGDIAMTGSFQNGTGQGTYLFTPDRSFVSAVEALGFTGVASDKFFASAVLDVKLGTISELRNSGITVTDFDDVFKAVIFKIDATYINDMNNAGFQSLDLEGLVQGKIFKIDAEYARQIFSMGFGNRSFNELVKFRIFKVTPEFLSEMRSEGFTDLNAEQVVQLRIFKIDSDFIREMRAKGYSNPTVDELVQLKIRGRID